MVDWKPIKVKEQTYNKVILVKGVLEQVNMRPVSVGETIDAIFLAACQELAKKQKITLPKAFLLEVAQGNGLSLI